LFQQAIQADPRNPIGYYNLGVVDQTERDVGAALREYRLAVEADPRYVPALYNEAVALSGTDRAQAISLYQQVISLQPDSPTALLNLGLLDFGTGRPSQGKVLLRRAVKLEPSLESKIPASIHAEVAAP
jgi:tetratricopeptide (TPR) repeat protein